MAKVTVVAKVVAKKESVEALKVELLKMIAPTRNEEGCIEYRLHQDNADPSIFLFYENWLDQAFLTQHMNSPHFRHYVKATESLIAEKTVHLMAEME